MKEELLEEAGGGMEEPLQHLEGAEMVAGVALKHGQRRPRTLQDPPLQAAGHGLGHWGGTGGQLWGQRGRVGSQGVTGGQGCMRVNGG